MTFTTTLEIDTYTQEVQAQAVSQAPQALQDVAENALFQWLKKSPVLSADVLRVLPAGRLMRSAHLYAKFRLHPDYAKHFVLLRGLFAFSQPKHIDITVDKADASFEVRLSETDVPRVLQYVETIIARLQQEIRFKDSLRVIVKYEEKLKAEQVRLYEALRCTCSGPAH